jgi:hypothetical protein
MQKTISSKSKTYVQFKDVEKSIINLVELKEDTRRIYQHANDQIIIAYRSGTSIVLLYRDQDTRDSDMRRITYLLSVRKAPGRPKTTSND